MFQNNDAYVKFLAARPEKKIYLKPYNGNSGDALIWMGTELLLKELGIQQVVNPAAADIILWCGGNPTMWETNIRGWEDCWKRWPRTEFVVGPATFQPGSLGWEAKLQKAPVKIGGLFARDKESFNHLSQLRLPQPVTIGLGHDPAFHLKDGAWITEYRGFCTSEYILASFRRDHESTLWPARIHRVFKALSKKRVDRRMEAVNRAANSKLDVLVDDAPLRSFHSFVECVQRAGQVHTDRLHCMILALLLGKPVFAYPTAYAKLESVYRHSIQPWGHVHFVSLDP